MHQSLCICFQTYIFIKIILNILSVKINERTFFLLAGRNFDCVRNLYTSWLIDPNPFRS